MTIELRWIASFSASCLHAARAMALGLPPADPELAAALDGPSRSLSELEESIGLQPGRLLDHLVPLSCGIDNNEQLAETAISKTLGPGNHDVAVGVLRDRIHELERVFSQTRPRAVEQLELRAPVLRQQWDARGPGLLHFVTRMTDPELIAPRADVVLVHPILGGGGNAHLLYNSVTIEAVLANSLPELPEVVRLAWMLSQINLDVPRWSENVSGLRLPRVAALAMVPITLAAAAQVELAQLEPDTIDLALEQWYLDVDDEAIAVDLLWQWWKTYDDARPEWPAALAALDRMLP